MSFVNDVNNYVDPMVGGSGDFPQRMLEQSYGEGAPMAFSPASAAPKSYKKMTQAADTTPISEIKEEQENLSDRLDKLESDVPTKTKGVKGFYKKHHKKIKTGILVGIALYAGYRLFLKGRLKFGHGGHTSHDPMPPMESGGEMPSPEV